MDKSNRIAIYGLPMQKYIYLPKLEKKTTETPNTYGPKHFRQKMLNLYHACHFYYY